MSPMSYLDRVTSPVMIHHGTVDESCPVEWAKKLNDSLMTHGKNVIYHEYSNGKHEFISEWPVVMKRTADFFDEYLKK